MPKGWQGGSGRRASRGITLIEIAAVVLIVGLVTQMVVSGHSLILTARVRNIVAQQQAAEAAVLGFRDRYRALPGDYPAAATDFVCEPPSCVRGDGNGRVEAGNAGGRREDLYAWTHLSAAGFVENRYSARDDVSTPAADNSPANVFGAYLQIASDTQFGFSGNASLRLNIKTGNLTPVEVLAEVDGKVDDGLAGSGAFQFSPYTAQGVALASGGAPGACTDSDGRQARWDTGAGQNDCGAATVLH